MRSIIPHLIFLLCLSSTFVDAQIEKATIPEDWNKVNACDTTFYLPPDFEVEKVRGIDTCVGRYRSKDILITLSVISYAPKSSGSLKDVHSKDTGFLLTRIKTNGRNAELATFYKPDKLEQAKELNYNTVLFVPKMHKGGGNMIIRAYTRNEKEREIIKKIFATISYGN